MPFITEKHPCVQEVLASSSSGPAMAQQGASEQALAAEVAALRGEVADALERGGNASEDPALAESLTRVTEVLDELRSQVLQWLLRWTRFPCMHACHNQCAWPGLKECMIWECPSSGKESISQELGLHACIVSLSMRRLDDVPMRQRKMLLPAGGDIAAEPRSQGTGCSSGGAGGAAPAGRTGGHAADAGRP